MKDFLTDFYNKVINFFQAEKVEGENTKETAKNRLKLVLMQDRSNLEPETMAQLREELIEVISKYIVIDKEALGLNLDGDGDSMALMLNIPVIRAKKPEEIQEALEAAKAKKAESENADETVEEDVTETEAETETGVEEETVVEFSEGSADELDLPCDSECECGCQNGEPCPCENKEACDVECNSDVEEVAESITEVDEDVEVKKEVKSASKKKNK